MVHEVPERHDVKRRAKQYGEEAGHAVVYGAGGVQVFVNALVDEAPLGGMHEAQGQQAERKPAGRRQ